MANPKFVLRSLDVYAMYGLNNLPPFGSPGQAAILTAINKEQGSTILARQVTFGPVTPTDVGDTLYNTSITLTSVANQGYSGSFTFRYNRADASAAGALNNLVVPGSATFSVTDTHSLIPLINAATGLSLVAGDIVNEPIQGGTNSVNLKSASTSYFFLPGSTFKVYAGEVAGDPWMLFDVNSMTDLMGTGATGVRTSATTDETYLIDGEPTLKITGTGNLTISLAQLFDSTIPEWTLEWSSRLNVTTGTYANLMRLQSATVLTFAQRTSDAGFGARIQQGTVFSAATDCWNLPLTNASRNGVLTRYAAQKRNGRITMYVDGVATKLANGTGSSYTANDFPAGAGVVNNDRLIIGLLAQNISHIRLSKFARYSSTYTPKPFKQLVPSFADIAPVTDALGFDPAGFADIPFEFVAPVTNALGFDPEA